MLFSLQFLLSTCSVCVCFEVKTSECIQIGSLVGCFRTNLLFVLLNLTRQHFYTHALLRRERERERERKKESHDVSFFVSDEFVVFVLVYVVYDESSFADASTTQSWQNVCPHVALNGAL